MISCEGKKEKECLEIAVTSDGGGERCGWVTTPTSLM